MFFQLVFSSSHTAFIIFSLISIIFFQNKYFYFEISSDAFFHFSEHRELLNTINADNKNEQEKLDASAN